MKYSVKYKRVFDNDGNIVDISTVNEANRQSEYYSIGSHTPMIAALGQTNQHYFRAKRGCQFNPETELHEYAKRVLKHRFETEDRFPIKYYRKEYCLNEKDCIFYDELNKGCGKYSGNCGMRIQKPCAATLIKLWNKRSHWNFRID